MCANPRGAGEDTAHYRKRVTHTATAATHAQKVEWVMTDTEGGVGDGRQRMKFLQTHGVTAARTAGTSVFMDSFTTKRPRAPATAQKKLRGDSLRRWHMTNRNLLPGAARGKTGYQQEEQALEQTLTTQQWCTCEMNVFVLVGIGQDTPVPRHRRFLSRYQ